MKMMLLMIAVVMSVGMAQAQTNTVTALPGLGLTGAMNPRAVELRAAIKAADDAYTTALQAIPSIKEVMDQLAVLDAQRQALLAKMKDLEQQNAAALADKKAAKLNARKQYFSSQGIGNAGQ